MANTINIKCPFCNTVMKVASQPGIENMKVECPVCHRKEPFTSYKQVVLKQNLPNADSDTTTSLNPGGAGAQNNRPGSLTLLSTGETFDLREGVNIIGRKASVTQATIQIPTGNSLKMSREHLVINVKNIPGKGFVHYVSLAKERVNPTFLGTERIEYGDSLILTNGLTLRLPDATLVFKIDTDNERTTF